MRFPTPLAVAVLAAALTPATALAQDYYTDVRPVLVESCMGCHTEAGIGWSMENAEETFERHRQIAGAVTTRQMPPWIAESGHQEYLDDLSLSDDVIAVVAAWREAGYPKGEVRPDPARAEAHTPFRADLSLDVLAGAAYLPVQSMSDDYRCFVVDWTLDEAMYVTGFRTRPGNENVAHHTVVHVVEPEMVERFREIDAEVEGAGYECFGGALPTSYDWDAYEARHPDGPSQLDEAEWWLAHWAPGMYGHRFPEGTGILVRPGSALIVQMHYYTEDAPGESDAGTLVDFELQPTVERPAFHLVQTDNRWLDGEGNGSMVIPAGEKATYVVDERLGNWVESAAWMAGVEASRIEAFEVHSANLHMHAFGHSGEITLTDPDGRTEVLLSVPEWNLHWQRDFAFEEPKTFDREELGRTSLRVSCTFANGTDEIVYGGFGSYDEMCFNFSYVSLRLADKATTEEGGRSAR
jgi:hypothetical protein